MLKIKTLIAELNGEMLEVCHANVECMGCPMHSGNECMCNYIQELFLWMRNGGADAE